MAKKSKPVKKSKKVKPAKKAAEPKAPVKGMIGVKADGHTRQVLQRNADKYANGNLSAWLRQSGQKYKPAQKAA